MKVTITYEFEDCYKCPYVSYFQEGNASGYICGKMSQHLMSVPKEGMREDCPLLKEEEE